MKLLKAKRVRALLGAVLTAYVRLTLALQVRRQIIGLENLHLLLGDAPVITAFWHETLPTMPILWQQAKRLGMTRPAVALASQHRDGQLVAGVLQRLGVGMVLGSSSKGGAAGLQSLVKILHTGSHIAITPDGPRGPARHAAAGVAALAGLSGAQIIPCGVATSRFITLQKSWDKMRVPLPFGHLRLVCGTPISVTREGWRASTAQIEAALNEVQSQAMQWD